MIDLIKIPYALFGFIVWFSGWLFLIGLKKNIKILKIISIIGGIVQVFIYIAVMSGAIMAILFDFITRHFPH